MAIPINHCVLLLLENKNLPQWVSSHCTKLMKYTRTNKNEKEQEGFLRCQTPTSAVRLEVEGCRVKNVGWRIESEKWRV